MFELGIYAGGSVAFWFEILQPQRLVAIDIAERSDTPCFQEYIQTRNLADRARTIGGINQADSVSVRYIALNEFSGPLDLVIDDASHIYEPTLRNFETFFPLLRPGGLYIIEDWAWEHARLFYEPNNNPFAGKHSLTKLVTGIIEATGSALEHGWENASETRNTQVSVYQGFTVIERGP